MTLYMVDKLAPNPIHFTRGLVKYVPGRGCFRAVPSQNGNKFETSPNPPIVEYRGDIGKLNYSTLSHYILYNICDSMNKR